MVFVNGDQLSPSRASIIECGNPITSASIGAAKHKESKN